MGRQAAALLLLAMCAPLLHAAAARRLAAAQASTQAPVSNPPMFLLFTHDDGVAAEDAKVVLALTDAHRNPNGCKLPATWFACTKGCSGFDCATAKQLHSRGHELADHTVNHINLRSKSKSAIKKEILGARDTIAACGIPAADIAGFRSPYLADSPDVRRVLSDAGFRYDSSVGAVGGAKRPWPAAIKGGFPFDCSVGGNKCSSSESYPSLWELPLYETPDENLMDYCTNESSGKPRPGCDVYAMLKQDFDAAYGGNKGPMTIAIHTPYLQNSKFSAGIDKFLGYALAKRDVWAVTMSQLLDWMERPVPASQMKSFMAKQTCP